MNTKAQSVSVLRKIGISNKLAYQLVARGTTSALQLAQMTLPELEVHLKGLDLGPHTPQTIHRNANIAKANAINQLMVVHGQVSPHNQMLASTNKKNNIIDFHQGMESYDEMFGALETGGCSEFGSMLGPSAYLVDLMRYIDEYIVQPEDYPALQLKTRRPDIWTIPLTVDATEDEVPYLQVANKVLQSKINHDTQKEALLQMAESLYPVDLPFNAPLEQIRAYLKALDTGLYDVYETFDSADNALHREYLGLTPETVKVVTTKLGDACDLNVAYGKLDQPNNPNPHFTGINKTGTDLGGLNKAEIFMEQLGLHQLNELEALFYQNIDTENVSDTDVNTLLGQLFVNTESPQKDPIKLKEMSGDWEKGMDWTDASYYGTVQTIDFKDTLYLLVRTSKGMDTWAYNDTYNTWERIVESWPNWSDTGGWDSEEYYVTIQTIVSDSELYLLGRAADGMEMYQFTSSPQPTWTKITTATITDLSNAGGWEQARYYATIQAVVADSVLYLVARHEAGIYTWKYDSSSKTWSTLISKSPAWSDTSGWDSPSSYVTVQTAVVGKTLFLIGRGPDGIHSFYLDTATPKWVEVVTGDKPDPELSNSRGFNVDPSTYSTIQNAVIGNNLYLLVRAYAGIYLYELDTSHLPGTYTTLSSASPALSNEAGWENISKYSTIQLQALEDKLYLIGRDTQGMVTYFFDPSAAQPEWVLVSEGSPAWSNAAGWRQPEYYGTIKTRIHTRQITQDDPCTNVAPKVTTQYSIMLTGCTSTGISTYALTAKTGTWEKSGDIAIIAPLGLKSLDILNRFVRLADALQWAYQDLDWSLKTLGATDIESTTIAQLQNIAWISKTLGLNLSQVCAFWFQIKTKGEGTGVVSLSLFDIIFNEPDWFDVDLGQPYHPKYAPGAGFPANPTYKSDHLYWNPKDTSDEENAKNTIRLIATLDLDNTNLIDLGNHLIDLDIIPLNEDGAMALDVPNLSILYRYGLLANTLELSIKELVSLFQFLKIYDAEGVLDKTNKSIQFPPKVMKTIIDGKTWVNGQNLGMDQLDYIIAKNTDETLDVGFDLNGVPDLLGSLSDTAKSWYLNPGQLNVPPLITSAVSDIVYNTLVDTGLSVSSFVDDRGIFLVNNFAFNTVSRLFKCEGVLPYTKTRLNPVFRAGNLGTPKAASEFYIPASDDLTQTVSKGTLTIWFRTDNSIVTPNHRFTLFNIAEENSGPFNCQVILDGFNIEIVLNQHSIFNHTITSLDHWHFLTLSFKEQTISLNDTVLTNQLPPNSKKIPNLAIPSGIRCSFSVGSQDDTALVQAADMRVFNENISVSKIIDRFYKNRTSLPSNPIASNTNYWPMNDGPGVVKCKDIAGDKTGQYTGIPLWYLAYNVTLPTKHYIVDGYLQDIFNPEKSTAKDDQPFLTLWTTIVKLRNILNEAIAAQKGGSLQALADYYQFYGELSTFADYVGKHQDPLYIQTLLSFRFALNYAEYELDLNHGFISTLLRNQFLQNNITLDEGAVIHKIELPNQEQTTRWIITGPSADQYLLSKKETTLNVYKPNKVHKRVVFHSDFEFNSYLDDDGGCTIPRDIPQGEIFFSYKESSRISTVFVRRGNYVTINQTEVGQNSSTDVLTQIDSFISELGHLLYSVNALGIDNDEFQCLVDNYQRFFTTHGNEQEITFSLDQLEAIAQFRLLNTNYANDDRSFTTYFSLPDDRDSLVDYVAPMTKWNADGLLKLSEWKGVFSPFNTVSGKSGSQFGAALAISHNFAVVGAPATKTAYVYKLEGEQWKLLGDPIHYKPGSGASNFGNSVAIQFHSDPDHPSLQLVIGDDIANSGRIQSSGMAFTYEFDFEHGTWPANGTPIPAPNPVSLQKFGNALALGSDILAIGAPGSNSNEGAVFIYRYDDHAKKWAYDATTAPKAVPGDTDFGVSLSVLDTSLAIGSAIHLYGFDLKAKLPLGTPLKFSTGAMVKTAVSAELIAGLGLVNGNITVQYFDIETQKGQEFTDKRWISPSTDFDIVLEDDTCVISDGSDIVYTYFIQDGNFIAKNQINVGLGHSTTGAAPQEIPMALNDGNLVLGFPKSVSPAVEFYGTKHDVGWFIFAMNCFELTDKLGVSTDFMLDFIKLSTLRIPNSIELAKQPGTDPEAIFQKYQDYANKLQSALKLGRSNEEWEQIYDPLNRQFLAAERAALGRYMIWYLQSDFTDINTLDDLYELLLIDVGSSGCRSISYVKAALNSLQLYVERSRLHLEPFVQIQGGTDDNQTTLNAADVEWQWMQHYRVWEANRKIFLYPETYYNPTVRKDQTDAYADLKNVLSQGNLTTNSAEDAFQTYFTDLETLTNLEIVSTCATRNSSFINGAIIIENTNFIFGRIKNGNGGYYYRTAEALLPNDPPEEWIKWGSWIKMDVSVKAQSIGSIYANNRPYIFWVEFTKQQLTNDTSGTGGPGDYGTTKRYLYKTTVSYSFLKANGQWSNPHVVPDPDGDLNFMAIPTAENFAVHLPDGPEINPANRFLDIANLTLIITAEGGGLTQGTTAISGGSFVLTLTLDIDSVLSLHDRYMWTLNGTSDNLRKNEPLVPTAVSWPKGTNIFELRSVAGFDGKTTGFDVPAIFNSWFNESFTIGVWVNCDFTNIDNWVIMVSDEPVSGHITNHQLFLYLYEQSPAFSFWGEETTTSDTKILPNEWTFLVFRYDAKKATRSIFINGLLDAQGFNVPPLQADTPIKIAGLYLSTGNYATNGEMADLFVTQTAITDEEVLTIYETYEKYEISDDINNSEWRLDQNFINDKGKDTLIRVASGFSFTNLQTTTGVDIFNKRQVLTINGGNMGCMQIVNSSSVSFDTILSKSFTVGVWVNAALTSSGNWPILQYSIASTAEFFLGLIDGVPAMYLTSSSNKASGSALGPISEWHFLTFVFEASNKQMTLYVDGVQKTTGTDGPFPATSSTPFYLGSNLTTYGTAYMADLFIIDTNLPATSISSIYKDYLAGTPIVNPPGGDLYLWSLNGDFKNRNVTTNDLTMTVPGLELKAATVSPFIGRQVLYLNPTAPSFHSGLWLPDHYETLFNTSFSVCVWIKGSFSNSNDIWPIISSLDQDPLASLNIYIADGVPRFSFYDYDPQPVIATVQENVWNFVVCTYDLPTGTKQIYVNGNVAHTITNHGPYQGTSTIMVGMMGSIEAVAEMANLFVVGQALLPNEITAMYDAVTVPDQSLRQSYYWQMNSLDEVQRDQLLTASAAGVAFVTGPAAFSYRTVIQFDGTKKGQLAMDPTIFNTYFNHGFTISVWVYGTYSSYGYWPILATSVDVNDGTLHLVIVKGKIRLGFYNDDLNSNTTLKNDTWYYLTFTYDAVSKARAIYINGVLDCSGTAKANLDALPEVIIGAYSAQYYTTGMMANLWILPNPLNSQEVLAQYQNGFYETGNLSTMYLPKLNDIQLATSKAIEELNQDLFIGGSNYMYAENALQITQQQLSQSAPYWMYYWELFYHIPMLVAQSLATNQQFDSAKSWYEYIYNPTAADTSADRFWQLGYFRSLGMPEDIVSILTDGSQNTANEILIYDLDPGDPEAIAYLRPGAFEKAVVMGYIQNLINWGDQLFTQYTWETITQSEMLYMTAKELLGKRPIIKGTLDQKTPIDFEQIADKYRNDIPQFIIDIEGMQSSISYKAQKTPSLSGSLSNFYFCIPENSELPKIYDLVDTRLYEIRNCLNILGQEQPLALFEPPIDPMALVNAAAGGGLSNVPVGSVANIPFYRFDKMIAMAKEMTQRVISFGGQILSALEKIDAEKLAMLRNTQERGILELTTSIKEQNVQEAMNQAAVLDKNMQSAMDRVNYYSELLAQPISVLEALSLALNLEAVNISIPTVILQEAAVIAHLIPTVFGFADGDLQPGSSVDSAANLTNTLSGVMNSQAQIMATTASYQRRAEEWGLQLKLAQDEAASLQVQKTINDLRVQNAEKELTIHNQSITNNEDLQNFYTDKFTNEELYQWMVGQISGVYYQTYQMAFDMAKKAETAYWFELNRNESIISYGYWDSNKKGLLAGEKLMFDLDRLEKAYADNNRRYLEIEKVISLKQLQPDALLELTSTGRCKIQLGEQLFDYDYPGHYNRKIKSISMTIPAIVGPYQTIKASLSQLTNRVVTQPDIDTVAYLVNVKKEQPDENSLRQNWNQNQQIVLSKASNDSGLFELSFNDSRYLPFEGTGAVSEWELSIPQSSNQIDLSSITDVIMYMNYTAEDGGIEFGKQVMDLDPIKNRAGYLAVSMKNTFSAAWNTFIHSAKHQSAAMPLSELKFPHYLDLGKGNKNVKIDAEQAPYDISLVPISSGSEIQVKDLQLTNPNGKPKQSPWDPKTKKVNTGSPDLNGEWSISSPSMPVDELLDIVFFIPFKAPVSKD